MASKSEGDRRRTLVEILSWNSARVLNIVSASYQFTKRLQKGQSLADRETERSAANSHAVVRPPEKREPRGMLFFQFTPRRLPRLVKAFR